jgi:hypothetical protein
VCVRASRPLSRVLVQEEGAVVLLCRQGRRAERERGGAGGRATVLSCALSLCPLSLTILSQSARARAADRGGGGWRGHPPQDGGGAGGGGARACGRTKKRRRRGLCVSLRSATVERGVLSVCVCACAGGGAAAAADGDEEHVCVCACVCERQRRCGDRAVLSLVGGGGALLRVPGGGHVLRGRGLSRRAAGQDPATAPPEPCGG